MTAQYGAINAPSLRDFSGNSMVGAGDYAIQMQQSQEAQTLNNLMAEQQFQHNQVMNPLTQQQMVGTNQATDLSNRLKAGTLDTDISEKRSTSTLKAMDNMGAFMGYAAQQLSLVPGPARGAAVRDIGMKAGFPPELVETIANQPDPVRALQALSDNMAKQSADYKQKIGTIQETGSQQRATQQQAIDAGKYNKGDAATGLAALDNPKLSFEQRFGYAQELLAKAIQNNDAETASQVEARLPQLKAGFAAKSTPSLADKLKALDDYSKASKDTPEQGSQNAGGVIKLD